MNLVSELRSKILNMLEAKLTHRLSLLNLSIVQVTFEFRTVQHH
jgi:hypothetical protein